MDKLQTNEQRYENGMEVLRKLTDENGMKAIEGIQSIFPDFGNMLVSFGFGDLYSRDGLDLKQRELITLTSLINQGANEQLPFHIHAALNVGLKPEELLELTMHCAGYAGFPKAVGALVVIERVFKERNLT
ncbi:carboxymuconolactone decarboxylase family protein [Bacillus solitudinis]|uniref:carboxymuconolactone decarboxylase family protein n=1 Tax=Bacillus solitudinis TaxID=2014074 RepID=UPI000C231072|nr:carboxymuconolactone decarboxylase family protein [Bacillus solitudinis]